MTSEVCSALPSARSTTKMMKPISPRLPWQHTSSPAVSITEKNYPLPQNLVNFLDYGLRSAKLLLIDKTSTFIFFSREFKALRHYLELFKMVSSCLLASCETNNTFDKLKNSLAAYCRQQISFN